MPLLSPLRLFLTPSSLSLIISTRTAKLHPVPETDLPIYLLRGAEEGRWFFLENWLLH